MACSQITTHLASQLAFSKALINRKSMDFHQCLLMTFVPAIMVFFILFLFHRSGAGAMKVKQCELAKDYWEEINKIVRKALQAKATS
jgi:hypothetical protein